MQIALDEAEKAYQKGEIPVGAVIVKDDIIIAQAHNENRAAKNPVQHAEILVIEEACRILDNERLNDCRLFVTKEPCAMCSGAIIHSRISSVIIGTRDIRYGACGTVFNICGNEKFNHIPSLVFDVLQEESSQILKNFFLTKRKAVHKNSLDSDNEIE